MAKMIPPGLWLALSAALVCWSETTAAFVPSRLPLASRSAFGVAASATTGPPPLGATQVEEEEKTEVRNYFNTEGFNRWNKIYSENDDVNSVQLDIRNGHDQTIQKILKWFQADQATGQVDWSSRTVCDCGCGVGSLALPLAQMGVKKVYASDISQAMAQEAHRRAQSLGLTNIEFSTSDLESVTGRYDVVTCIDVAIHYPDEKMTDMIQHLCSLSNDRVVISFAPKTWYYVLLKKVGEMFPGPSKTTRAYLHEESLIRQALARAGFTVQREEMTATNFYFSRLLEAKRM